MTGYTRRQVLSGAAVAGAVAVAGCSDGDASSGETLLGEVSIQNNHDDTHTVDVLVEYEGEIIHWSTHDLEEKRGENTVTVERDWSAETGEFRITTRLDEETIVERTASNFNDWDCVDLQIEVTEEGAFKLLGEEATCSVDGEDGE